MAYVNIPRDKEDPNYRYKMPKLLSKIEGRGNGIRTNVYNMGEIARALKRPPMYPTKFFGCELGAMVKFEENEEKALINGAHTEQDLVAILDKFIQMYVLCEGCELPEIDIMVKKGVLLCKCNACGYSGTLDNTHKAATYMAKNPPNATDTTLGKKKKTKEERRAEKLAKEEEKPEKSSKEKKSKDKEKKKKKKGDEENDGDSLNGKSLDQSGDATPTNDGDDSWDDEKISEGEKKAEKSEKKKKEKKHGSSTDVSKLVSKESLTISCPEIADVSARLRNMVASSASVTPDAFFVELRMLQVSQDFDAKCRMYVVFNALFKDGLTPEALEQKMPFVAKCCDSSVRASDLISALENFCFESEQTSMTGYPYLLQRMYNAELLEPEDILEYYAAEKPDAIFEKCKTYAEPFLKWLAEADSSEEE
ncbi:eukaryotic translation initiation factor 5 [Cyclospora cayetanensis]|uniref:Eukaryotic translation initiation factor 5 n=1 Tax=Cyclospora cayetanensis TaxID=88456 RepID=A0A6P6RXK0_9EIME|nr:eukaryotic translation initiation factor 5 [Cyclospora cayetanensis]